MSGVSPAGYSGTPLPAKLGIKPGATVALIGAPRGFEALLSPLAPGVRIRRGTRASAAVIVAFCVTRAQLQRGLPGWRCALAPGGGLWIAWPKRSSGVDSDLDDHAVRELGLAAGLVDNKVCAIDATWSGLRFVYRRADRAPSAAST